MTNYRYHGNTEPFFLALYGEEDASRVSPVLEGIARSRKIYAAEGFGSKEKKILPKASAALLFLSEKSAPALEAATEAMVSKKTIERR